MPSEPSVFFAAIIGVVLGGFVTYLSQARLEHRKWLRDQRRTAYSDVVKLLAQIQKLVEQLIFKGELRHGGEIHPFLAQHYQELSELLGQIHELDMSLRLLGLVGTPSNLVFLDEMINENNTFYKFLMSRYSKTIDEFLLICKSQLEKYAGYYKLVSNAGRIELI